MMTCRGGRKQIRALELNNLRVSKIHWLPLFDEHIHTHISRWLLLFTIQHSELTTAEKALHEF